MRNRVIISILLIVATVAVFWPVHNYGFLDWDDDFHVFENPYLVPATLDSTLHFWKESYRTLYIPFTYTTWAGLAWLSEFFPAENGGGGMNPHVFHTANLILHIVNTLIAFSILRLLLIHCFTEKKDAPWLSAEFAAGVGALIFAIHPLHVEPVAWVTGMKDMLGGFFSLLTIREYLIYAIASKHSDKNVNKNRHYVFACIAFILAMLSKPVAVVMPLVLLILDRFAIKRAIKKSAVALIGWFIVAGLFALLTRSVHQSGAELASVPFWAKFFIAGDTLAFYLYKLFLPLQLGIDYGRSPEYVMRHWWAYVTWLFPLALIAGIWFSRYRNPLVVSFGIFAASLIPVVGFVSFRFQAYSTPADRYIYISVLGLSLLVSWLLHSRYTKVVGSVCVVVIVLFGIRSALQVQQWKDEFDLYNSSLKVNPNSALLHYNLGTASFNRGKVDDAISYYQKVVEIKPDSVDANYRLGYVMAGQGKFTEALPYYENAVRLQPNHLYAHNDLGVIYASQNKLKKSISHLKKSIEIRPGNAEVHYNLGVMLKRDGNIDEAVIHFSEALRINPRHPLARKQLEAIRPTKKNIVPLR